MAVIAYIQANPDEKDIERQRHLLLEYAQNEQMPIDEFIYAEFTSRRDTKKGRIDELRLN